MTVRTYTPSLANVTLESTGFCAAEVNPPGPVQLYEAPATVCACSVADPPTHTGRTGAEAKAGGSGFTVTVNVAPVAHEPAAGVNVYVVVAVLFAAGDHVPLMPLVDVAGSTRGEPLQIGAIALNAGATIGFTVTVLVAEPDPHGPVPLTV